jgi:hypothetical protein
LFKNIFYEFFYKSITTHKHAISSWQCAGLATSVCLAKHTVILFTNILFSFYFEIWSNKPFFNIKKFPKYMGIFVDLFVAPHALFYCFLFCVFFSAICLICGPLLLNANMLCNAFLFIYCCLNRVNNKRVNKQKKA